MNKEKTAQVNEQLDIATNKGIVGNTLYGCLTNEGIVGETINGVLNCECIQQNIEISHRKFIFK